MNVKSEPMEPCRDSSPSTASMIDTCGRKEEDEDDLEYTPQQPPSSEAPGSKPNHKANSGIDAHPFARGSVIEVICKTKDNIEDDDEGSDDGGLNVAAQVRLADIIDRAPSNAPNHEIPSHRWRYYVHYRDLNRRMDEWIEDPKRIVGPPSVGNAKVRAIKKAKAAQDEQERKAREASAEERRRKRGQDQDIPVALTTVTDTEGTYIPANDKKRTRSSIPTSTDSQTPDDILSAQTTSRQSIQRSSARRNSSASVCTQEISDAKVGPVDDDLIMSDSTHKHINTARLKRKSSRALSSSSSMVIDESISAKDPQSKAHVAHSDIALISGTVDGEDEEGTVDVRDKVVTLKYREMDEHEGLDEASLREHEEVTKVKNVAQVQIGPHIMDAWYFSPLPKELFKDISTNSHLNSSNNIHGLIHSTSSANIAENVNTWAMSTEHLATHSTANSTILPTLFVCEFTLQFFARKEELLRYQAKGTFMNQQRHPPGHEIYRAHTTQGHLLSMFEVDGYEEKFYCQNLCYIAKLFLDHKTLYYDVDPFLFYVLCEVDERGYHPVGYFSKEKYSDVGYNLACILTFPCHQRKGYGRFLISFSYELSKKEERVGSPEKPMSDLGQQAYKPYWASVVVDFLLNQSAENSLSIMEISKRTSIMVEDIIFTLNMLGLLKCINDVYFISAERSILEQLEKKYPIKEPRVDPSKLHWTPFITDVKRDKFSIHSKRPSVEESSFRASGSGGF